MFKLLIPLLLLAASTSASFAESQCSLLFSNPLLYEQEYRVKDKSYLRREINVAALSVGEFSATDTAHWAYKGKYNGNSFNYRMTSGRQTIEAKGACTSYGAIGKKAYIKGGEKYLFTWRIPTDFKQ